MLPSQLPEINLKELASLCAQAPHGAIVEVGVYQGGSAFALSQVTNGRPLHLFDTFRGIPEESPGDVFSIGSFGDVDLKHITDAIPRAHYHIGIFPATLPDDLQNIAFVHVDCDQRITCRNCIKELWPRMVPGGIMAFDDYRFQGIQEEIHSAFPGKVKFTQAEIAYLVKDN